MEGWLARPLRILDVGTGVRLSAADVCWPSFPDALGGRTDSEHGGPGRCPRQRAAARRGAPSAVGWQPMCSMDVSGTFDILDFQSALHTYRGHCWARSRSSLFRSPAQLSTAATTVYVSSSDVRRRRTRDVVVDGWAVLEVGYDQADAVAALLASTRFASRPRLGFYRDVAGRRRCVAARTRN